MNPCKCGGEVHLDYKQGDYTGQYWYAICNECGTEYPLKSNNRIDAEREWNNRKEGIIMNYIPKVAKILGVEIGQEFICHWNIVLFGKPYTNRQKGVLRFTKTRLEINTNGYWDLCCLLQEIIQGELIITEVKEQ